MKWKCLKCGSKVSIWASVCPYCNRDPGGFIEHILNFMFFWLMILGIIGFIIHSLKG